MKEVSKMLFNLRIFLKTACGEILGELNIKFLDHIQSPPHDIIGKHDGHKVVV